jgi:hypothetical protein
MSLPTVLGSGDQSLHPTVCPIYGVSSNKFGVIVGVVTIYGSKLLTD